MAFWLGRRGLASDARHPRAKSGTGSSWICCSTMSHPRTLKEAAIQGATGEMDNGTDGSCLLNM